MGSTVSVLAGGGAHSDGPALDGRIDTPKGLVVEGATVFVVCGNTKLRMYGRSEELVHYLASCLKFAQAWGILDPREKNSMSDRERIRGIDFASGIRALEEIQEDRDEWYVEARERLQLPAIAVGMKGPEGVPCFLTYRAWRSNTSQVKKLEEFVRIAASPEHAKHVALSRLNSIPTEHLFGAVVNLDYQRTETMETYVPLVDRHRDEFLKSQCRNDFAHVTQVNPVYWNREERFDIHHRELLAVLESRQHERKLRSDNKERALEDMNFFTPSTSLLPAASASATADSSNDGPTERLSDTDVEMKDAGDVEVKT